MRKRITDIISMDDAAAWKPGDNVLINAQTGTGKSYFCKNTLYELARREHCKILMLIHRTNCVEQFKYEIQRDGKGDVIKVLTYQSLEYRQINQQYQIDLAEYRYIISDEFHYFFNDSSFNNRTAVSFEMIMNNTESIHVFMSATGTHMFYYMRKYLNDHQMPEAIKYEVPYDFSFINNLTFFHNDNTMRKYLDQWIESGEKAIFFIQSAQKAYSLFAEYRDFSTFCCSTTNEKYKKKVDEKEIRKILINEKFDKQFLITTACFDSGINIVDRDVKHIVVDMVDMCSLIQCIGRKRIQDDDDKVNVYIKAISNQRLGGIQCKMKKMVEMAEYFMKNDYSVEKLIAQYPMQNDVNNIIYDSLVYDEYGNVVKDAYQKKINEVMYFKKKLDISTYARMLKFLGDYSYCKELAKYFGFFDEVDGRYFYKVEGEADELEEYLCSLVDDKVVFLTVKDRAELIKKISAKQNGKLLRKAATLNSVLDERDLDYRIKEFETMRQYTSEDHVIHKKKYKHAWKIVRFQ